MSTFARRRAQSGRLRSLAHLVPRDGDRLSSKALCGFQPKRYWGRNEAPVWEDTCQACEAKAARS